MVIQKNTYIVLFFTYLSPQKKYEFVIIFTVYWQANLMCLRGCLVFDYIFLSCKIVKRQYLNSRSNHPRVEINSQEEKKWVKNY